MQLNSGEKKAVSIIVVVALVFAVAVGGTVAALVVGKEHDDKPYLQLAIDDQLVRVDPARWCDLFLRECEPADPAKAVVPKVPVPIGSTALLSVSEGIASTPWQLYAEYITPRGSVTSNRFFRPGTTYTVALPSTPDAILVTVEVQLLSAVASQDGSDAVSRGYLAANTTPPGIQLPDAA